MRKVLLILFRILIPLLCAASAAAFFLPSISLEFSKEDGQSIEEFVKDYREAEESQKAIYEGGGKSDVMIAIEDDRISVADVIVIHSQTDGNEAIKDPMGAVDEIYNGVTSVINDNYMLVFILIAVSVIFILASMIFSAISGNKYFSIFAVVSSGLFLAVSTAVILVFQLMVIPGLDDKEKIGAAASPMLYAIVAAAGLALVLAVLRLIVEKTASGKESFAEMPRADQEMTVAVNSQKYLNQGTIRDYSTPVQQVTVKPVIVCLAGSCQGMEIPIEANETVTIGREPSLCNIIARNAKVSRQHCTVTYDKKRDSYIVTDLSQNGTFLENGTRLMKDHPNLLPSGSVIYLMDRENMFRLGKK